MKFIKENLNKIILSTFVTISPLISFAQANIPTPTCTGKICNPLPNINSLSGLIKIILEGLLKIGIPIIALAVIYCGFLFVSARGKPEEITKAKDALLYTLIGAAILLGSWAIAQLISNTVTGLAS